MVMDFITRFKGRQSCVRGEMGTVVMIIAGLWLYMELLTLTQLLQAYALAVTSIWCDVTASTHPSAVTGLELIIPCTATGWL